MASADIPATVGEDRHLPECPCDYSCLEYCRDCICDRLRACERRVREDDSAWDDAYAHGFNAGRAHGERVGRAAGLRDAVEAVRALHYVSETRNDTVCEALAAIDALLDTPDPNQMELINFEESR